MVSKFKRVFPNFHEFSVDQNDIGTSRKFQTVDSSVKERLSIDAKYDLSIDARISKGVSDSSFSIDAKWKMSIDAPIILVRTGYRLASMLSRNEASMLKIMFSAILLRKHRCYMEIKHRCLKMGKNRFF